MPEIETTKEMLACNEAMREFEQTFEKPFTLTATERMAFRHAWIACRDWHRAQLERAVAEARVQMERSPTEE